VATILLQRLLTLTSAPGVVQDLALGPRGQILGMLELGRSNRDIAERLDIAVHTVKNHVHSLLAKLRVTTRAQAAAMWRTYRSDRGTDWS
jgi:DNA-binding NarL/FixJ family response regulator